MEIYRKKKTAIPGNEFESNIRKQKSSSFQLNQVQDGFWDARPLSHRGVGPLSPYGPEAELYALRELYEQEAGS